MKTRKTLALFAFALLALGVTAQQAQAQTDCSTIPSTVTGSLTINQTGDCNITHAVTVNGGDLTIIATGNISTQAISAPNGGLSLSSTGTTTLNAAISVGVNMLLHATGNFKATDTLTAGGGIEIAANSSAATTTNFRIGSSTANGVAGVISAGNGVFITNGNATATGGITLTNGNKINVAAPSHSNSGLIILNAQNGNLTLMAGTLSTNGASGQNTNGIALMANTVIAGNAANSTVITANDGAGAPAHLNDLGIAAQTLMIAGSGGLKIQANGPGQRSVSINPQHYLSASSNGNLESLSWTVTANASQLSGALTVTGAGLTVTSNGVSDRIEIAGYPLTFSNGAMTFQSKGDSTNQISVGYSASSGQPGLLFNNTGAVVLDASAANGKDGGNVSINADQTSITNPSFVITANGPASGNGAGGKVSFNAS